MNMKEQHCRMMKTLDKRHETDHEYDENVEIYEKVMKLIMSMMKMLRFMKSDENK